MVTVVPSRSDLQSQVTVGNSNECRDQYNTILYFTFPYYRTLKDIAWLVTLGLLRYLIVNLKPY